MNSKNLIKDVESNVIYQLKKISTVFQQRQITNLKYLNEYLHPAQKIDEKNSILNQALSDSILNSMASLIDYYSICCMLKIGVPEERIRKIQYRSLNNRFLIDKSTLTKPEKELATIDTLLKEYNAKLSANSELEPPRGHDYWMGFLGSAISHTLKEYGALESSHFELRYNECESRLEIDQKIEKYYFYMRPFFCNPANPSGVKHNIYIDINNFLKHNAVPYLSTQIETFEEEHRVFSYFEIQNSHSSFLKDGILKDLVISGFEELKRNLEAKYSNRNNYNYICQLEDVWGLGRILTLDSANGYISPDNKYLYFYIDGVLMAKSESTILVDADKSFLTALQELKREIDRGLNFTFE